MALLGNGWDDPKSSAIMALAGGLLRGDMGGGLLWSSQAFAQAKQDAIKQQYLQAQMDETLAQAKERQLRAQREEQALQQQAQQRAALPGLFQGGGGQPGAPGVPAGFDVMRAIQLGMDPKMIQEYAALQNLGRPKATRQMEVDDGKGGKRIALVDDFGQEVAGFAGYTAPVQVNRGNRIDFVRPEAGASLSVGMSPEAQASNALGWANHSLSKQRLGLEQANAAAGKVPAGYRLKADGTMEYIPGGPADPNAAKRAAPTEFQGKSAIYGSRAQEADRIIGQLEGKYSPAAVNAKTSAAGVPLIGGALEAAGNLALSSSGQKAEQAQRDFINAILRQESGAVISEQEFANARKQYFPQPFDTAEVKAQKAANRRLAIQGIMNNARASSEAPTGATGTWDKQPSVDDLLKKYGGK